jgi:hypothetical protein
MNSCEISASDSTVTLAFSALAITSVTPGIVRISLVTRPSILDERLHEGQLNKGINGIGEGR